MQTSPTMATDQNTQHTSTPSTSIDQKGPLAETNSTSTTTTSPTSTPRPPCFASLHYKPPTPHSFLATITSNPIHSEKKRAKAEKKAWRAGLPYDAFAESGGCGCVGCLSIQKDRAERKAKMFAECKERADKRRARENALLPPRYFKDGEDHRGAGEHWAM